MIIPLNIIHISSDMEALDFNFQKHIDFAIKQGCNRMVSLKYEKYDHLICAFKFPETEEEIKEVDEWFWNYEGPSHDLKNYDIIDLTPRAKELGVA
jgi:hypothetical protein